MVNQNPEPIVLSENFEIQAGANSGQVELTHEMATPEIMNIFACYIYIYPGFLDIGTSTDFPAGRRTWTDIDPVYIPVLNNADRPNDSADPAPLFVTLPLCCNPRPWTDLTMEIIINSNPVPSRVINLGAVAAKLDRTLPFSTPIKIKGDQHIYLRVTNNNPVSPADWTFTKIDICLNGEVLNYEQLRKEKLIQKLQEMQDLAALQAQQQKQQGYY